LNNIDRNAIYGDVVYLRNRGFITGKYSLGDSYPNYIRITKNGIDQVEYITYKVGYMFVYGNHMLKVLFPISH
jgi:hypothetical protein